MPPDDGYHAFWHQIHRRPVDRGRDRGALDRCIHPNSPPWFNLFFDRVERLHLGAVLRRHAVPGASAIEVGCGGGRWVESLVKIGVPTVGLDFGAPTIVENVRLYGNAHPRPAFVCGSADRIPFRDGTFHMVLSVTCLQHIPDEQKEDAIREICRVSAPGAAIVLLEHCRREGTGYATHMFPLPLDGWIARFHGAGADLIETAPIPGLAVVDLVEQISPWFRPSRLLFAFYIQVVVRIAVIVGYIVALASRLCPIRKRPRHGETILVFRRRDGP